MYFAFVKGGKPVLPFLKRTWTLLKKDSVFDRMLLVFTLFERNILLFCCEILVHAI